VPVGNIHQASIAGFRQKGGPLSGPAPTQPRADVVTFFRMSDQVSSEPQDHEPEAQPAADEAPADHTADDSKAEAGEAEQETPKPSSEQRGRPESRFSVLTALISAAAALIGAIVGGVGSYVAARSQATAQFSVAEANNRATADQALITRKQAAYSDFTAAEKDLEDAAFRFGTAMFDFKQPNIEPIEAAFSRWDDVKTKWEHAVGTVELVDSPDVRHSLQAILEEQDGLRSKLEMLYTSATYWLAETDMSALARFSEKREGLRKFDSAFLDAAKRDISGQS
jgi:hypothetical protein